MSRRPDDAQGLDGRFVRRTLFQFAVAAGLFLLWHLSGAVLLAFAAVIVAVLLRSIADPLAAHTPVKPGWAVLLSGLLLLSALAGAGWLFGSTVVGQTEQFLANVPRSVADFRELAARLPFGDQLDRLIGLGPDLLGGVQGLVGRVGGYAMNLASAITSLVLVIVAGVFLAASPGKYRDGVVILFPKPVREPVREAADASGRALKAWLVGQFADMVVVGVLTALGVWLIGLPSPIALGLFAALAGFVPIVGTIAGAVPGLLLAVQGGWELVLWTLLVYVVVQQVEGNLVYPFIQKRAVDLPPILTLFGVVVFGILFGIMGVLIATPMMVVIYVSIKLLYLRKALEEEVSVPGDGDGKT